MDSAVAISGVRIRLNEERWGHIASRHPEMSSERARVLETISAPDFVQLGDAGELCAVRFYEDTHFNAKYLVVVYRETTSEDGFVLTAYLTSRPSATRVILWKR